MDAWDDIRLFMTVVRYGSVRGAATALKVNHTTVSRRLRGLERRLGSRLIQRTPDGYVLTADGDVVFASGEIIEREVESAKLRVQGSDETIGGKVRINMSDLFFDLTGFALQSVIERHPALQLEVTISSELSDISRSDADIALRVTQQPPEDLIGKIVGRLPVAVYGAKYLGFGSESLDLGALPWIRWREPWKSAPLEIWAEERFPGARVTARVDTYAGLERFVALGAGVGLLTPWSADKREDLVRLTQPIDELETDIWLLMHPDLRGVRRITAVMEAMTSALAEL